MFVIEARAVLKDAEILFMKPERLRDELRRRVMNAQDAERTRIARELHDDIGQSLAILKIQLLRAGTPKADKSGEMHPELTALAATVQAIAQKVSNLSHQLHSPELEFLGLPIAVKSQCRECSDHYHIPVTCICTGLFENLNGMVGLSFLRVVQEALHNAAKYSRAKKIKVDLVCAEKQITLAISDNGVGFDVERSREGIGLGLISMRERMQLIGGDFEVLSQPGAGTTVKARAPIVKARKRMVEAHKEILIKASGSRSARSSR